RDDLVDLGDRAPGGGRHDGVEVAGGLAVDEVAPAVGALRLHQREVGMQGVLQHLAATVDRAHLLALGERRAERGRAVEGADAGAGRADALGPRALRAALALPLAGWVPAGVYP